MGNQLSHALADIGLVSKEAVAKQSAQEIKREVRKQRKAQNKRHLQTDEGRVENYSSPSEFMEYARQRLKTEGYSDALMDIIFREAHQFADAKLTQKNRNRMHGFLCQLKDRIQSIEPNKQKRMLRDGRRAFQQMNAKNL